MVSVCPLISKCSSPFTKHLGIVPSARIGITVTFMFHTFFSSQARSKYLSFFSLSFIFTLWSASTEKYTIRQALVHFFFFDYHVVVWARFGDVFVSQNPIGLCASHFSGRILGCSYYYLFNLFKIIDLTYLYFKFMSCFVIIQGKAVTPPRFLNYHLCAASELTQVVMVAPSCE